MKKFIYLILVCVLLFNLVACGGGQTVNNDTSSTPTGGESHVTIETPKYNLTFGEKYTFWGTTDEIAKPSIPALVGKVTEANGIVRRQMETPLNLDTTLVLQQLKELPYIQQTFADVYEFEYEVHNAVKVKGVGDVIESKMRRGIKCVSQDGKQQLEIYAEQLDTHKYVNLTKIRIAANNLPQTETLQNSLYAVVKCVFGDYADFLVYSRDTDGSSEANPANGSNIKAHNLIDFVQYEKHDYIIERLMTDGGYDNIVDMAFSISIRENGIFTTDDYCTNDYSNTYTDNPYTPKNVLSENFGTSEPYKTNEFGSTFLSKYYPDATNAKLDSWNLYTATHADGSKDYKIYVKMQYSDANNKKKTHFEYSITANEKDGIAQGINFYTNVKVTDDNVKVGTQAFIDKSINVMEYLFDIDLPSLTVDGKNNVKCDTKVMIAGKEYDAKFGALYTDGSCNMQVFYDTET